ncbi:hypothetical protein O7635_03440 [Asanoa sp. WMMD1127]|uniref:LpqB family beta-propeller domain-containing protein n=1 Tax=Asanoa sp. WMMD1127 TaxID=3016107 RepID=UPI0024165985|nr:LpqB family beta-propeller domain-containing protein [Asanoa sp. WMMD1127]MDG4820905.1 hypothetical protein [Asanoa sp. WMMD1127]
MRRRFAGIVAVAGLAAGLVAGCGIPDHSDVKVEKAGPVQGAGAQTSTAQPPPERDEASSIDEFVRNFLEAPAGEFERSQHRVQDYMSQGKADNINFKSGVALVRLRNTPEINRESGQVKLTVTHLGVLNANGEILPPTRGTETYLLQVNPEPTIGGYSLAVPPPMPLLNVNVLSTYYTDRTVYFWNSDRSALVPDLRWLPREVGADRVPTELLKMIENGPSPSVADVAQALPEGSKLLINAPIDNGQLTMNWSPKAVDNNAEDFLAQQAAWTVRGPDLVQPQKLQLKINGQALAEPYNVEDLLHRMPYPVGPDEHAYTILDGRIRALAGTSVDPPVTSAANQNLRSAAFNRHDDGMDAAVVTRAGDLRLGTAVAGGQIAEWTAVPGVRPVSPPVWIPRSRTALVITDSGLYKFGPGQRPAKLSPKGVPAGITHVAAAPDGQRIALIASDRLYVAPVVNNQDDVSLSEAWPVAKPLDAMTAVAWSGETALAVGGTDDEGRLSIYDVTIDGARRVERIVDAQGQITTIAAYPESTALGRFSTVLYEAENVTWLTRGGSTKLTRAGLAGVPSNPSPGTDEQDQPTAPFFIY